MTLEQRILELKLSYPLTPKQKLTLQKLQQRLDFVK